MEENRELSDPAALLIKVDGGNGSGFLVGKNLIATNIHVVARTTSVSAKLIGTQTEFVVEGVTAFDPQNDLVILKIAGEGTPLPIGDSDLLQAGDIVQAIGCPNGKYEATEGTVHGILRNNKWVRMRVRTSDGSSGGPVLNRHGEVIGIVISAEPPYSHAIPGSILKVLLDQAQAIEPLAQWRERKQIRAYACLVQSKIKHKANSNDETMIVDLDKAAQLNPDFFLFYFIRGNMKVHLGQSKVEEGNVEVGQQYYHDAIGDYTEAIKLCPDYVTSYNSRGVAKSHLGQSEVKRDNITEAQQYYHDAIANHTKAIKLCPDYALAYNNQADVKLHFGKSEGVVGNMEAAKDLYQEALIDINTAIKLDSNIALFFHTRGEIRHAFGDYSAAIEDYEKAREIDPDYTDVCKDLKLSKKALEQQNIL